MGPPFVLGGGCGGVDIEDRLRERERCGGWPSEGDGVCRLRKSLGFVALVVVVPEEKAERPDKWEEKDPTLDGSAALLLWLPLLLDDEVLRANGWEGVFWEWPCEDDGGSYRMDEPMAGTVLLKCAWVENSCNGCVGVPMGNDELGGSENCEFPPGVYGEWLLPL